MNADQPQRRSKEARTTETKDRLLQAARDVARTDGLSHATSRSIADAAEANLGAITYHFGSKEDLLAAAVLAEVEQMIEPALKVLESDADPAARLLQSVGLLLGSFAAQRDSVPLYFEAVAAEMRTGSDANGRLLARVRVRLGAIIDDLRRAAAVPHWVDPVAMSSLILATAQGIVLQSTLEPHVDADSQVAQFAGLLLAAGSASNGPTSASPVER